MASDKAHNVSAWRGCPTTDRAEKENRYIYITNHFFILYSK